MDKNIPLPTDGSAASNAALEEAFKFAIDSGSAVRVVYECEDPPYILAEGPVDLGDAMRQQDAQVLAEAAAKAGDSGVDAETALIKAEDRRVAAVFPKEAERPGSDFSVVRKGEMQPHEAKEEAI